MALLDFCCKGGHAWQDIVEVGAPSVCPECGGAGSRNFAPSRAYGVTKMDRGTEGMSPGDLREALINKRAIEADSEKVLSGEIGLRERGPKELRPQLPDHLRRHSR